jgi:hypothetical protein
MTPATANLNDSPDDGIRPLAIVHSLDEIAAALRDRIKVLNVSYATVDLLTGLPEGYAGKLLGGAAVRKLGHVSLPLMLKGTGLALAVVEDPEAYAQLKNRYVPRCRSQRAINKERPLGARMMARLVPLVFRDVGRRGGLASAQRLTAEQRSARARKAALARHQAVREKREDSK